MTTWTLPEPPSANRYWRLARGRLVIGTEARRYRDQVQAALLKQGWRPRDQVREGEVELRLEWHRGRRAGDLDNRAKVCCDALQGFLYANDSQVAALHMERFDGPRRAGYLVCSVTPRAKVAPVTPAPTGRARARGLTSGEMEAAA